MSILDRDPATATGDEAAIASLRAAFAAQKKAFIADPYPSYEERMGHLGALAVMMMTYRTQISDALTADFGSHPVAASDLIEVLGVAGRAQYAMSQLQAWMADEERHTDPALFGTARATVRQQAKGVIGNIVPWNFPFDLSVGPLVEMLAAGNRVIIKPSDYTPACAEVLREMIAKTFEPDRVTVAIGGLELARMFPTLRWDHLLYTGSPHVGREVMLAAAQNLVPVTLELGGKCPAIVLDDAVDAETVTNVLGTKMIKNGQTCISVDYLLVPKAKVQEFVGLAREHMNGAAAKYSHTTDCTGIISERHLDRLLRMLQQAKDAGYEVVDLEDGGAVDRTTRRMPLSLVLNPGDETDVMREEVFGPILPVIGYDSLDEAIARVNNGERPLGLYVFGKDTAITDHVLQQTTSGGACVNACAMQGALPSLGFGGSGTSGMGRHHGIEGFREFSNPRGVVVRGTGDLIPAFSPPYAMGAAVADAAFAAAAAPPEGAH
jgi:coniferyl-aldehyde dehydrogenase